MNPLIQAPEKRLLSTNFYDIGFTSPIFVYRIVVEPKIDENDIQKTKLIKNMKTYHRYCIVKRESGLYLYSSGQKDVMDVFEYSIGSDQYQIEIKQSDYFILKETQERSTLLRKLFKRAINQIGLLRVNLPEEWHVNPLQVKLGDKDSFEDVMMALKYNLEVINGKETVIIQPNPLRISKSSCLQLILEFKALGFDRKSIDLLFEGSIVMCSYLGELRIYRVQKIMWYLKDQIQEEQKLLEKEYSLTLKDLHQSNLNEVYQLEAQQLGDQKANTEVGKTATLTQKVSSSLCQVIINQNLSLYTTYQNRKGEKNQQAAINTSIEAFKMRLENKKFEQIIIGNPVCSKFMKDWSLEFNIKPQIVETQQVRIPKLVLYKSSQLSLNEIMLPTDTRTFDDVYSISFLKQPFANSLNLEKWVIIAGQKDQENLEIFTKSLSAIVKDFDYRLKKPHTSIVSEQSDVENFQEKFMEKLLQQIQEGAEKKLELIFIVIPSSIDTPSFYNKIQQQTLVQSGILCQCVQSRTLQKYVDKMDILTNRLIAQISAKLGEVPWTVKSIPFVNEPGLIIGLSVQKILINNSYIVSGASSMQKGFSKYYSDFAVCDRSVLELSVSQIVQRAVQKFIEIQKIDPIYVIIFREGYLENVSSPSTESDMLEETIKNKVSFIKKEAAPKVTYITYKLQVRKRAFISTYEEKIDFHTCRFIEPGVLIQLNKEGSKFILFTKREEMGCPYPGEYEIVKLQTTNSIPSQDAFILNIYDLISGLLVMNPTLSTHTTTVIPLQYAYKQLKFLQQQIRLHDGVDSVINFEKLRALNDSGLIYYI